VPAPLVPAPLVHPASSPSSVLGASATSPLTNKALPPIRRADIFSSADRESAFSETPTEQTEETGNSKDGKLQRKKSTIRNALSKFFGRRRKTRSQDSSQSQRVSALMALSQHRSVCLCFFLFILPGTNPFSPQIG
jgi:hypothetical protein